MIKSGMVSLANLVQKPNGGAFFSALREAWQTAAKERRAYLFFAEWEVLFKLAEECGLIATIDTAFVSPFGLPLLRLWRAMRDARAAGQSELEFWSRWDAQCDREHVAATSVAYRPPEPSKFDAAKRPERRLVEFAP